MLKPDTDTLKEASMQSSQPSLWCPNCGTVLPTTPGPRLEDGEESPRAQKRCPDCNAIMKLRDHAVAKR